MRVQQEMDRIVPGETTEDRQVRRMAATQWAEWVLSVGDGKDGTPIPIPDHIHLPGKNIEDLIQWVYPDLDTIPPEKLIERAILALRNKTIDELNAVITKRFRGMIHYTFPNPSILKNHISILFFLSFIP